MDPIFQTFLEALGMQPLAGPLQPPDQSDFRNLFDRYQQGEQDSEKFQLNVNPMTDIRPFQQNPFQGYLQLGGGIFTIPKFQPLTTPTFGNRNYAGMQQGGAISMGYRDDPPVKDAPFLEMPGNVINMNNVSKSLYLKPDQGSPMIVPPNSGIHIFPEASKVTEIPIMKKGGYIPLGFPLKGVQTEKGEYVIHPTLDLSKVNARKKHKSMADDEITDFLPVGAYVASNDKSTRIGKEEAEDIVLGVSFSPYREMKQGKLPTEITLADIFTKKTHTPAELAQKVKRKFPIRREHEFDVFTQNTNRENRMSRLPFLGAIAAMNDEKREGESDDVQILKKGGKVESYQLGDLIGEALGGVTDLLKFGVGSGLIASGVSNASQGIRDQVRAQREAIDTGLGDLSQLRTDLLGLNNAAGLAGIAGQLGQETELPRLQLNLSALQNFRTRTPQQFIEQAAAPQIDIASLLGRIGGNQAATFAGNEADRRTQARNQVAMNQFSQDRGLELQLANQLTNLINQEERFNLGQEQQEIDNRNRQISGLASTTQQTLGQRGNILNDFFTRQLELQQQRASMEGAIGRAQGQLQLQGAGIVFGAPTPDFNSMFSSPNSASTTATPPGNPFMGGTPVNVTAGSSPYGPIFIPQFGP